MCCSLARELISFLSGIYQGLPIFTEKSPASQTFPARLRFLLFSYDLSLRLCSVDRIVVYEAGPKLRRLTDESVKESYQVDIAVFISRTCKSPNTHRIRHAVHDPCPFRKNTLRATLEPRVSPND